LRKQLSRISKIKSLFSDYDLRYLVFERFSFYYGKIFTTADKLLYNGRLRIESPFRVWGRIRFLIHGSGSISIGKDFHAVSTRRRSFITLFSPCHLTVVGTAEIVLGDHVGLNGTTFVARKKIIVGDNTMIGPNTIIVDHDAHAAWPPSERWIRKGSSAEIIIEPDVWIGMNCIILKGVRIGIGSIIAAGSVVIEDVDPHSLYAGNPAKKVKEFADKSTRELTQ